MMSPNRRAPLVLILSKSIKLTVLRLQESERIRMYVEDKLSALENEGKEKPEKITKVQFFLSKCVL